eukprot:6173605-Prymnesium_polylepis.1
MCIRDSRLHRAPSIGGAGCGAPAAHWVHATFRARRRLHRAPSLEEPRGGHRPSDGSAARR